MNGFEKLFTPGQIGKIKTKNRIVMSAMAMFYVGEDGFVSERQLAYYAQRARGGVGLIITEAAYPRRKPYPIRLEINDDKYIPGLSRLAGAIHDGGAKAVLQMNVGRGRGDIIECVSASDVPTYGTGVKPRALTVKEIETYVAEFGEGSRRAKMAGFDGIQIHANGGYLVDEFLSPYTNRRTDEYGGDVQRRAKFALDLVKAVKDNTSADYPILFKLMSDEHIDGGLVLSDSIAISQLLEKAGVDAIEVVSGNFHMTDEWAIAPMSIPRCYNAGLAAVIKRNIGIPVLVGGRIIEPAESEEILRQSKADFIALGRSLMADPEWPNKARSGKSEDIRRCISCLHCMEDLFKRKQGATCTVNPVLGEESSFAINPAKKVKRLLIVGGGPAGMEAAYVCSLRGHQVTLWEKAEKLGGQLNIAVKPPHKEEIGTILEYYIKQLKKLVVKVELRKEATAESITKFSPDAVIIATGATQPALSIPCASGSNVITAEKVLSGEAEVGENVIILGGGLVGCETAEFLRKKGREVIILKAGKRIGDEMYRTVRETLLRRLETSGVRMVTGVEPLEITASGVKGASNGSTMFFPADTVVLAKQMKAVNELSKVLAGKIPELHVIGDSSQPRRIFEAIYEGAHTGISL